MTSSSPDHQRRAADAAEHDPGIASDLDIDIYVWDFSLRYFPKGNDFFILGGLGWATVRAEFIVDTVTIPEQPAVGNPQRSDDAFTLHAGLGGEWDFGNNAYFLAQVKARWLDSSVYADVDIETMLGIGFRFGG